MDIGGYKLIIEDDEGRRSVVPVDLGEVSIGRLEGNTIRLKERNVSRRHARLIKENGGVYAEDLGSFNGVWVNGNRIAGRRELYDGDLIKIGDFHLELRGEGLAARKEDTTQKTLLASAKPVDAIEPGLEGNELPREVGPLLEPKDPSQPSPQEQAQQPGATEPSSPQPSAEIPLRIPDGKFSAASRDVPTSIIRVDQISEDEPQATEARATVAGPRGKLVCVSTQFAGQEYELSRTEMTMGRTDENDICVPHRSVSRQHAKVAISGRRFKIIDLGSANGTLVNDEEYAQTELKRGDLIELGHVRFRFVPPGETYAPTPEEQQAINLGVERASSRPGAGAGLVGTLMSSPPLLLGVIGVILAAAVVVAVLLLEPGGDEGGAIEEVGPEHALEQMELGGAGQGDADGLFKQASAALKDRQWKRAFALATAVLAINPDHEAAATVARQAETEDKAHGNYRRAVAAIDQHGWSEAWNSLQEIPEQSAYREQAETLLGQVRAALVNERIYSARAALADENWDQAAELATEIAGLDPDRAEIEEIRDGVRQGRARVSGTQGVNGRPAPAKPRAKANSRQRSPQKAKPGGAGAPAKQSQPQGQSQTAQELYLEGARLLTANQFQKAVEAFNRCMVADKKFALCFRALGIAYARLGNGPKAARYYRLYLKVDPNAPDADKVKKFLQQYDEAQR